MDNVKQEIWRICKKYHEMHVYSEVFLWRDVNPDGSFEIQLASPYGKSYYTYYKFNSVKEFEYWQESCGEGL